MAKTATVVPKYAWGLVVANGLIWLVIGAIFFIPLDILFGNGPLSAYSAIAMNELSASSRLVAVLLMISGLFQVGLGSVPLRMGERWAWYTYSGFPLLGVLGLYAVFLGGGELVSTAFLFVVLPSIALLLSVRSVFLRQPRV
ncbi:MAG: hypothetical protein KGI38_08970 [Thaumarchaeota archaeon]|nr:hypothetical protein [Nitrososphaerota archaeon]